MDEKERLAKHLLDLQQWGALRRTLSDLQNPETIKEDYMVVAEAEIQKRDEIIDILLEKIKGMDDG